MLRSICLVTLDFFAISTFSLNGKWAKQQEQYKLKLDPDEAHTQHATSCQHQYHHSVKWRRCFFSENIHIHQLLFPFTHDLTQLKSRVTPSILYFVLQAAPWRKNFFEIYSPSNKSTLHGNSWGKTKSLQSTFKLSTTRKEVFLVEGLFCRKWKPSVFCIWDIVPLLLHIPSSNVPASWIVAKSVWFTAFRHCSVSNQLTVV